MKNVDDCSAAKETKKPQRQPKFIEKICRETFEVKILKDDAKRNSKLTARHLQAWKKRARRCLN
jgi:hypothetical protein